MGERNKCINCGEAVKKDLLPRDKTPARIICDSCLKRREVHRLEKGTQWDEFEERVKSLLLFWRSLAEAHPGHEARCIGACVAEINQDEFVKRRKLSQEERIDAYNEKENER